ncbi:hypothetical protein [Bradyrhizobium sp. ORS 111]|uniref:hypothetical protein n=1 Tax=Bradyrhizobium sp. ORS 111 TaxID=1685958 RepID=UPI00388D4800
MKATIPKHNYVKEKLAVQKIAGRMASTSNQVLRLVDLSMLTISLESWAGKEAFLKA